MATVRDLVRSKNNSGILSIMPDSKVIDALKLMAEKNVGALLVMSGARIDGILSERDCVRKVELLGRASRDVLVKEIMTSHVVSVDIDQSLEECMSMMNEHSIRHLPVFEHGRLIGVISVRDVLREIVSDQRFMIDQLSRYISGVGR